MKLLSFKIAIMLLFFTSVIFGQKMTIYKNEIEVKKATILKLYVKNIPLKIIESLDNTIYLDFVMKFKNYTKKEMNSYKKKLKIKKTLIGDTLSLTIKSPVEIYRSVFAPSSGFDIVIPNNLWHAFKDKEKNKKKTKEEIINQIFKEELNQESMSSVLLKQLKKDKKAKLKTAHFTLRIPKRLKFKIDAIESVIRIEGLNLNGAELNLNKGSIWLNKIINSKINIKDADLKVVEVEGGSINLLNATKNLIGSVKQTSIEAESAKIEIGEIGKNVTIQDFNSELFLYSFSSNFQKFSFIGEYSKIHFYEPIEDYGLSAFGHNTTFHYDKMKIVSQPSKSNKKSKMMDRKPKTKNPSGIINFDIMHSIFYYPTSIIINK